MLAQTIYAVLLSKYTTQRHISGPHMSSLYHLLETRYEHWSSLADHHAYYGDYTARTLLRHG